MKALVFYDTTGKIWLIAHGETTLPPGVLCMWVDIENGVDLIRIDLTDPQNPKPVFSAQPDSEIGKLQKQMAEVQAQTSVNVLASTFAAETFTDEQALQVPSLYAEWSGDSRAYKTGIRLNYGSVLYKVLQDHTSQADWTPDVTPSLYAKVLIPDTDIIPEWEQPESTNGYSVGDKVTHNGVTYVSLVDNNTWEPGVTGTEALWEAVTEE